MRLRDTIARQPQTLWIRPALFQIHLWTGIGVGLYIVAISVTGSAVVFRLELAKALVPKPRVTAAAQRLSDEDLTAAAQTAYPRSDVARIWSSKDPTAPVEIWLTGGRMRRERLFDPYTGRDLGDALPYEPRLVKWLVSFHDNLLGGPTGRRVNGAGAVLLTVLCLTGAVIWWPGTARVRRSLIINWTGNWRRFNWDLHSTIGFWMFPFVLMWALSGIYLSLPEPFHNLLEWLQPFDPESRASRLGDSLLAWLARIHFGRAWGPWIKALWVVLGLVPVALFVTGAVMWWNRVLSSAMAPSRGGVDAITSDASPQGIT